MCVGYETAKELGSGIEIFMAALRREMIECLRWRAATSEAREQVTNRNR